jgi:hypothetical protein
MGGAHPGKPPVDSGARDPERRGDSYGYSDHHSAVGVRPCVTANTIANVVGCLRGARDRFLDRSRLSRTPQKALMLLNVGTSRLPIRASAARRAAALAIRLRRFARFRQEGISIHCSLMLSVFVH